MHIDLKGTALTLTPALRQYIDMKLGPLGRFVKRYEAKGEICMFLEVARTTKHHKKGEVFYAEVTMKLPKAVLRAEATQASARAAVDMVKDIFKREIDTYKEKHVLKPRQDVSKKGRVHNLFS